MRHLFCRANDSLQNLIRVLTWMVSVRKYALLARGENLFPNSLLQDADSIAGNANRAKRAWPSSSPPRCSTGLQVPQLPSAMWRVL